MEGAQRRKEWRGWGWGLVRNELIGGGAEAEWEGWGGGRGQDGRKVVCLGSNDVGTQ